MCAPSGGMENNFPRRMAARDTFLLFLASTLYVVGYPPIGWWPLSFIGFSIFLRLVCAEHRNVRQTGYCFFVFCFGCYLLGFYSIAVGLQNLFDLGWIPSLSFTLLFCAAYAGIGTLGGILWGIISNLIRSIAPRHKKSYLALFYGFLLLWVTFTPKPANWDYHTVIGANDWLLSSVSILGTGGWKAIFLLTSIALAALTLKQPRWLLATKSVSILGFVLLVGGSIGYYNRQQLQAEYIDFHPVSLIQDNTFITKREMNENDGRNYFGHLVKTTAVHQRLVREIAEHYSAHSSSKPQTREPWVIWPENSMLTDIINDRNARVRASNWAAKTGGLHFVGGSELLTINVGEKQHPGRYNVVAQFSKDGYINHYRKQIPIPWGEYVPGGKLFPKVYELIPDHYISIPSKEFTVLEDGTPDGPIFMPIICYEILFADHLHRFVETAKERYPGRPIILLHLASDGWFGNTTNPYFQALAARWQAAALRLPLIRVSNTGFSQVVSPAGEVLHTGPRNQQLVIFGEVPLPAS